MTKLTQIEGIGEKYSGKLQEAGISTQEKLLEAGETTKGRKALAEQTGISEKLILGWINRADLARVKGIGEEYADLLELAGVDTVPELAQRNAANLHTRINEVAETRGNVVRRVPSLAEVEKWVTQARALPRAIHY